MKINYLKFTTPLDSLLDILDLQPMFKNRHSLHQDLIINTHDHISIDSISEAENLA